MSDTSSNPNNQRSNQYVSHTNKKSTLSNIKTKKIQGKIDMQKMKQGQKMNMQIHNNTNSREKEVDQRYLKKKTYENAIDKGAKKDNTR